MGQGKFASGGFCILRTQQNYRQLNDLANRWYNTLNSISRWKFRSTQPCYMHFGPSGVKGYPELAYGYQLCDLGYLEHVLYPKDSEPNFQKNEKPDPAKPKRSIHDLGDNDCILLNTIQDVDAVCELTNGSKRPHEGWNRHGAGVCYYPKTDTYATHSDAHEHYAKVYPVSDFLVPELPKSEPVNFNVRSNIAETKPGEWTAKSVEALNSVIKGSVTITSEAFREIWRSGSTRIRKFLNSAFNIWSEEFHFSKSNIDTLYRSKPTTAFKDLLDKHFKREEVFTSDMLKDGQAMEANFGVIFRLKDSIFFKNSYAEVIYQGRFDSFTVTEGKKLPAGTCITFKSL